jgi:pimeloyl-ACP methyl ester carboxylesterase
MVAGGILALPTLAACTASAETPAPSASASPPTGSDGTSTPEADVHEIDLGDGRVLYMSCAGSGEQTVVLESGYHESSDTWMVTEDETDRSVFARLADRYRVCAYDRPGTLLLLGDSPSVTERSTPVPMPRSAADVVDDLHTAFDASGESGPFILTAHSLGGFLARLYAQTYPDDLDGLVFVDAFPIELRDLMGDTWAPYSAVLNSTGGGEQSADYEQIDI